MALFGLAILGIVLGAAGMQFLRSRNPELVERAEDGIKRFVASINIFKKKAEQDKEK